MYDLKEIDLEGMPVFSSQGLREQGIGIYFTTRYGGVSNGPYDSLNLAFHVGDDLSRVSANRKQVLKKLDLGDRLYDLCQVHSDKAISLNEGNLSFWDNSAPEADALITQVENSALMVMGADCNLIILADKIKKVIAAVHAGWKGTLAKILGKTIQIIINYWNSRPEDCLVFLGPSIRRCCYRVDKNRLAEFTGAYGQGSYYDFDHGQIFMDLADLNKTQALQAGIPLENIVDSGLCTFCDKRFFSYRRAKVTGRQAAIGIIRG